MREKGPGFCFGPFFWIAACIFSNRVAASLLRCDITKFDDVRLVICWFCSSFMNELPGNCIIVMGENEDVR